MMEYIIDSIGTTAMEMHRDVLVSPWFYLPKGEDDLEI